MDRTPTGSSQLSRVDSFQFPNAHLGHLTEGQQASLDSFRELCQTKGYYTPASEGKPASHDDATLLRYLRARKFNPQDAFVQYKDTEDWRKENHLEELYNTIDVKEYEDTRRLYPQWTGRRDKRGIPVYIYKVAHLDSKTVSAYEKAISKSTTVPHDEKKVPTKMLRLFALYENLMNHVLPLCTAMTDRPNPETPVTQSSNIVDISGVSLRQFWNLKSHMQDASTLATAHYPETLDRIFIIGAPSFFPTVWGWIKRWFDPITVSKIFILSNASMKSTLEQYIDIANIPKKYGGTLDFEFGNMPVLEPAFQERLKWQNYSEENGQKTFPTGPIRWSAVGSDSQAVALGTVDGKKRDQIVATMTMGPPLATPTTGVPNFGLQRTTTADGTETHPKEEGDLNYGAELQGQPGSSTPSQANTPQPPGTPSLPIQTKAEKENNAAAANGQATVAAAAPSAAPSQALHPITSGSSGKTGSQPRVGTSETRLKDQEGTHADGKLEEGTPAVVDHGHGDKTVTMEPMTVGQAPKAKVVPELQQHQPTLYERAQGLVGAAYEEGVHVAEKVGLVKSPEQIEKEKEEEERRKKEAAEQHKRDIDDPKVNTASEGTVENFLRDGLASGAPKVE